MIVVTGAAGFIGSCLVSRLLELGRGPVVAVDNRFSPDKARNLDGKAVAERIPRAELPAFLAARGDEVEVIFHLGARTDTLEKDPELLATLNQRCSQNLWRFCAERGLPFLYASSAATYGLGERGFVDSHAVVPELTPLNPYGDSKNEFDIWALAQDQAPPLWAGLKFFNVYGPNESHKGRMASVILHAWRQIRETGRVALFRSHRDDIADGHQSRDFIYVKDVLEMILHLESARPASGLYNIGTGEARSFLDLATATFAALELEPAIDYIDTPASIRAQYQYFTEADMTKFRATGYEGPVTALEDGVRDYVTGYLEPDRIY